jgi:hypothetical protein
MFTPNAISQRTREKRVLFHAALHSDKVCFACDTHTLEGFSLRREIKPNSLFSAASPLNDVFGDKSRHKTLKCVIAVRCKPTLLITELLVCPITRL